MGSRAVTPGGALLRTSRMFSIPKPLPEPQSIDHLIGEHKSDTATRAYPQHQVLASPFSSREKGDWGLKRPFPLKTTLATSTPFIRVKQIDTVESITDFASGSDSALSLEKFREMRVAMSVPRTQESEYGSSRLWSTSVFEEKMDFTDLDNQPRDESTNKKRWKFQGPWLARMTQGAFNEYLAKKVRPRRDQFRQLLREKLAKQLTASANSEAMDQGQPPEPAIKPEDISQAQFADYVRSLRDNRILLYDILSQFLDMAPIGHPAMNIVKSVVEKPRGSQKELSSPYEKTGPPRGHPSAGIGYLRTNAYMENHPVYGPQALRAPVQARVVSPRRDMAPAKLGVGGFVAYVPDGDNEFNLRHGARAGSSRSMLAGISYLDTTTVGGAKAFVDPKTATVDPSGRVVLALKETKEDAKLISLESKGAAEVYTDGPMQRSLLKSVSEEDSAESGSSSKWRMDRVADAILDDFLPPREQSMTPDEVPQETQQDQGGQDDSRGGNQ